MSTRMRKHRWDGGAIACAALLAAAPAPAAAQATLLPNAIQQFFNANGTPLSGGSVFFYIPQTTTPKTVWGDAGQTTPYSQPVQLNAAGEPSSSAGIYGSGSYRQQVFDSLNNLVWDATTASTGTSSGGGGTAGDGMPLGFIMPFAGPTPPSGYDFAAGQSYSRATFASLLSAITITQNATCTNGSNAITGLSTILNIGVGQPIESLCLPPGTTVASITGATSITVSANATAASGPYSVQIFPFSNGNGATTFNLPDLRGRTFAGADNMNGAVANVLTAATRTHGWDFLGAAGGTESYVLLQTNLPAFKPAITITDPGHTHTVAVQQGSVLSGGGGAATGAGSTTTSSATTGVTAALTSNLGSATAMSLVQPTITINYVIKVNQNAGTFTIPIANNTVLGNNSGISNPPAAITASAVLDMISSTRGSLLERGVGSWGPLTPPIGSAGQCLTSQGPGLDPQYQACGSGTVAFSGTSGGIVYFSSPTTAASTGVMTANQLMLGGGAGVAPSPLGSLGTTSTLLHGNAAGAPSFGSVQTADIATNAVANANLAQMSSQTFKCNNGASTANAADCALAGVDQNVLNTQTANYSIATSDCGKTIQAGTGSTGQFTVTLPAVAGFPTNCKVTVFNGDTGRAKFLSGFPVSVRTPLYPLQGVVAQIINGAWAAPVFPGRWLLTGSVTFFVDTTNGSDSNDGLAAGTGAAFKTVQKAASVVSQQLDLGGLNNVTIQLADGTYGETVSLGNYVGRGSQGHTGPVVIQGNAGATTNVKVTSFIAVETGGFEWVIQNLEVDAGSGTGILADQGSWIYLKSVSFGAAVGGTHINAENFGLVEISGDNYTISGGAAQHLFCTLQGRILFAGGNTITLTGTPAFSNAFAFAGNACQIYAAGLTFSGAATGQRYNASGLSNIQTLGGGATYFPGNSGGSNNCTTGANTIGNCGMYN